MIFSLFSILNSVNSNTSQENQHTAQGMLSCDGLFLEGCNVCKKYCIRNPAMHQIFDLPSPHKRSTKITCSYASSSGYYKVVYPYIVVRMKLTAEALKFSYLIATMNPRGDPIILLIFAIMIKIRKQFGFCHLSWELPIMLEDLVSVNLRYYLLTWLLSVLQVVLCQGVSFQIIAIKFGF